MIRSTEAMRSSVSCFGVWSVMSTPTSRSVSADSSLIADPGLVPAESTVTVSPAILRMRPAAIWDLPPFLTQTNSTEGLAVSVMVVRPRRGGVR